MYSVENNDSAYNRLDYTLVSLRIEIMKSKAMYINCFMPPKWSTIMVLINISFHKHFNINIIIAISDTRFSLTGYLSCSLIVSFALKPTAACVDSIFSHT